MTVSSDFAFLHLCGSNDFSTVESSPARKRKGCLLDDIRDINKEDNKFAKMDIEDTKKCARQNHSEIEKRRRDKMNTYITELSAMVPMCNAMSRKLDKLTVLRMAVQHLKTLRGSINPYTEGYYKPSFLSDDEVKHLILKAAEGFLFVVGCDRGRILYVSESVFETLNYTQADLLGQSWFDILHPKDIAKVKEQLSSPDLSPRERLIDAKTMLPVKAEIPQGQSRLCLGSRRSFFCRMKYKTPSQIKEESDNMSTNCQRRKKSHSSDRKYSVIYCTGYLKSWPPAKMGLEEDNEADNEGCNLSCLVAVGRQQLLVQPSRIRDIQVPPAEFVSRHSVDGKFIFVDLRFTQVLGYLPQELLGTSCYEYYHQDDIPHLADSHKAVLQSTEKIQTRVYRFRAKNGNFVFLQTKWFSFRNPWTKEVEYVVNRNTVALHEVILDQRVNSSEIYRNSSNSIGAVLSTLPQVKSFGTRIGAGKIGRQIADEALEQLRGQDSSQGSNSPSESLFDSSSKTLEMNMDDFVENNSKSDNAMTNTRTRPTASLFHEMNNGNDNMSETIYNRFNIPENTPGTNNEGNDEAAMAVIMSLLEADAGLGGPVDFSDLPWPL